MTGAPTARHFLPGGRDCGGIGRMVAYLVDAAAAEGETHLVTDTRGPVLSPVGSPARLLAAVLVLVWDRIAAPERVQHIHVAGRGSTVRKLVITAVARALGSIHVLHLHDYGYADDLARRPAWQRRLVARMFRRADRIIVLGRRDRETVIGALGAHPDRVALLPNAVPEPALPAERQRDISTTILFLGRLGTRKGVPELIEALASPAMGRLAWRAVLAGDGPIDDYRVDVARLGLSSRVELPGWLNAKDTAALLATADLLVLPSREEGLSMAVLEGLAHGLAVVTTRVGAHEEVITDGETGVFVPVGDAETLAAVLARLIADAPTRFRLSRAARDLHQRRFAMTGYVAAIRDIHRAGRSARRRHRPELLPTG